MSIPFGGIELDPIELAINGNAILGIKESGKSYLGTELGEIFFDAKIPFITFDPIGIWHNMRYPGRGKGFPVVVTGGFHGDVPLTPANAPSIVEAAMREGVSLVLDLFHPELSKADWRKIVKDCAFLLLHRNAEYGLRHIFIEEAAEFVPQTVRDGQLFDAVERVIRMGGNSRLGCTLISPRSQEVNKSVLELCETLFLFRQRGKNALENIKKWLDVAGADATNVMKTLPNLPKGECWAWLGSNEHPFHIKVPQKRSFHPDRRATGEAAEAPKGKAVDAKRFIGALTKALPAIEEEAKAYDPKLLRARVKELEGLLAKEVAASASASPAQAAEIERLRGQVAQLQAQADATRPLLSIMGPMLEGVLLGLEKVTDAAKAAERVVVDGQEALKKGLSGTIAPTPLVFVPPPPAPRPVPVPRAPVEPRPVDVDGDFNMTPGRQKVLDKIAWGMAFFNEGSLERGVLGFLLGKHPRTKSLVNDLSALKTAGYIDYLAGNRVGLTAAGGAVAAHVQVADRADLIAGVMSVLSPRQGQMLTLILGEGELPLDGDVLRRSTLAEHFGNHERTKSFVNDLSRMKSLGLIYYGPDSTLGAADFLRRR